MKKQMTIASLLVFGALMATAPATAQDQAAQAGASDAANAPQNNPEAAARERRPGGGHSKDNFVRNYDANGDGRVSLSEFIVKREEGYAARDADGNGSLTNEEYVNEFVARLDQRMAENRQRQIDAANFRFSFMDSDENSVMTAAEFHESGTRMFKRLDTNEDGVVDDNDTADSF